MRYIPKINRRKMLKAFGKLRKEILQKYQQYADLYLRDRSLRPIERFVFGWLAVFTLGLGLVLHQNNQLSSYYLVDGPRPGGHFIEGVVGDEIDVINPIFYGDKVTRTAEKLVFSSLFAYDADGEIVPDLAVEYEIDESETVYTITIRPDVYWHDGEQLTARDVVYTFQAIQNPDTGASLQVAWQGIRVRALDDETVEFTLPNPYAPFLTQLTSGIVPSHLLSDVEPDRLRVAGFNQSPIGSGPFMFSDISSNQVRLRANPNYYRSQPQLDRFTIAVYPDNQAMIRAYNRGELSSMIAGSELDISEITNIDRSVIKKINLSGQVFVFYNTKRITEVKERRALTQAINLARVASSVPGSHELANSPLLPGHLGYMPAQLKFNTEAALNLMKDAGWELNDDGKLEKDGDIFRLRLVTQDITQYMLAAEAVASQWEQIGIETEVLILDTHQLQQDVIRPREFDVLLLGIALGSDPDVFAYWHSSQGTDTGRNLSQYESETTDISLEDGRTRTNEQLRAAKYETFQQQWRRDAPATALYRLHMYYVYRNESRGVNVDNVKDAVNRLHNVQDWTINTQPQPRLIQE